MDSLVRSLIDFTTTVEPDALPDSVVQAVIRHTVDSVACGAGGFSSPTAAIARASIRGVGGPMTASAYGESSPVLVDSVAFANATANRYLDFNDFGPSGHPSDMIPALLAIAESSGSPGREAIAGIYIAYEIATALAEAVPPDGGWDQGIYCSLGVAAGAARILGLDRQRTADALSLAAVPSLPLRVTRFGELSAWKASATAHATMTACHAVRLAMLGMQGPAAPFEGKDGIFERVWAPFSLDLHTDRPAAIERASLKRYPACFWGQVGIDLAVRMREHLDLADIAAIDVATTRAAWWAIGGGRGDAAQKWRPTTRETADHSLPYLLAVGLVDGEITEAAFAGPRLSDPALLTVIDRINVTERSDLTAASTRDRCPTEITVRMADGTGSTYAAEVACGHPSNPMSDAAIAAKFDKFTAAVLPPDDADALATLLWGLADLPDLAEIGRLFRAFTASR